MPPRRQDTKVHKDFSVFRIVSRPIFFFFLAGLLACGPEAPPAAPPEPAPAPGATVFHVNIDGLRLRDQAGEEGKVIRELDKGAILYDQGEVSSFTTRIRLRGIQFDEPWLKVVTEDSVTGWVYGGALHFDRTDALTTGAFLLEKRLQSFFGPTLTEALADYRRSFRELQTAEALALTLRRGQSLRDTLVDRLASRVEVETMDQPPDLFWLEEAMPGFVPQLVAEGTAYFLFTDFRAFAGRARITPQPYDDQFIGLCLQIYPEDSIEYFFPVWTLQTWDYGGHSLLGRGIHHRILDEIGRLLAASDLFQPELYRFKLDLLNDITRPNVTYWETQERALAELDSILATAYPFLTRSDEVGLRARREQFLAPEKYQIEFNHQAGIYD